MGEGCWIREDSSYPLTAQLCMCGADLLRADLRPDFTVYSPDIHSSLFRACTDLRTLVHIVLLECWIAGVDLTLTFLSGWQISRKRPA